MHNSYWVFMKLVAYRKFRPQEEVTPKAQKFYGRMGITESFLRDVSYSGPHELAWAFFARCRIGRKFSAKLRSALATHNIEAKTEERPKLLKRITEKLKRHNRSPGLEVSGLTMVLTSLGIPMPAYPVGSVRDIYGVRVILPLSSTSRDKCYDVLDVVLEVAGIKDATQILSLVDYLAYPEHRFGPGDSYLGRYESLQVSLLYLGVPIEVQIRDARMDHMAKTLVKRNGLD